MTYTETVWDLFRMLGFAWLLVLPGLVLGVAAPFVCEWDVSRRGKYTL